MSKLNLKGLHKLRRPSGREKNPKHSVADVDEYNNRQHMRCVGTRPHWKDGSEQPGPRGLHQATRTAAVESVVRAKPSIEAAAVLARDHLSQEAANQLAEEVEKIIRERAEREVWLYNETGNDCLRLLASIVVEEWLHPAKFWRKEFVKDEDTGEYDTQAPYISSFARVMKCDRRTWHRSWKKYFMRCRGIPEQWYQHGKYQ